MTFPLMRSLARAYGFLASVPSRFNARETGAPAHVGHSRWAEYLSAHFNRPGCRVLEVGSRIVTGANLRSRFDRAHYVGFDFHPGDNVDVVGDAHRLASYFEGQEPFDLVFTSAVFEHLYMPWVAADQIRKVLKVGGHVFIETHFSHSSHERPWHFFQFSDLGLRVLFSDAAGFDLVDGGLSNPIAGFFGPDADGYLRYLPVPELYCHSEILCRKRCEVSDFDWNKVSVNELVGATRYPAPAPDGALK